MTSVIVNVDLPPADGLARHPGDRPFDGASTYHYLVDRPRRTRWVAVHDYEAPFYPPKKPDLYEIPEDRAWWARARVEAWEGLLSLGGCLGIVFGLPVACCAFWLGVSYVVMIAAWVFGAGDLHPFPH